MYAIAFFTTVILFSVSLFIGTKVVEYITNQESNVAQADVHIRPVASTVHIGLFRFSA